MFQQNISQRVTDRTNSAIVNTYEVTYWLLVGISIFDLSILKVKVKVMKVMHISTVNISQTVTGQTEL